MKLRRYGRWRCEVVDVDANPRGARRSDVCLWSSRTLRSLIRKSESAPKSEAQDKKDPLRSRKQTSQAKRWGAAGG